MTCDVDCSRPKCGDGVVNELAGESCDDAGATATCDVDCTRPMCGDGVQLGSGGNAYRLSCRRFHTF